MGFIQCPVCCESDRRVLRPRLGRRRVPQPPAKVWPRSALRPRRLQETGMRPSCFETGKAFDSIACFFSLSRQIL